MRRQSIVEWIAGVLGYAVGRYGTWTLGLTMWNIEIDGRERIPKNGAFLLCPIHRSYVDGPLTCILTPRRMRYLSKDSMFRIRPLGWLFRCMGAIPVVRGVPDRKSLHASLAALEAGIPLVLFPEGTRKEGPTIEQVNEGAAYLALRADVPVVPVGIGGSERAMPKGARFFHRSKVVIIVGEPLSFPSTGDGRAQRAAVREATDKIAASLQELFDEAQRRSTR